MALSGRFRPAVQLECALLKAWFVLDDVVATEDLVRSDAPQVDGQHRRYERIAA